MIENLKKGSGRRLHAGWAGKLPCGTGILEIRKAAAIGIDANLWEVWKLVVAATGLHVTIDSIDTGEHAPDSRHYCGCATDTDAIGLPGQLLETVTRENPHAQRLVEYLHANGFLNHEMGPHPAVLLGSAYSDWNATGAPHAHHMHVSIARP